MDPKDKEPQAAPVSPVNQVLPAKLPTERHKLLKHCIMAENSRCFVFDIPVGFAINAQPTLFFHDATGDIPPCFSQPNLT